MSRNCSEITAHAHSHKHTHTHNPARVHAHAQAHTHTHTHTHTHSYTQSQTRTHKHTHNHIRNRNRARNPSVEIVVRLMRARPFSQEAQDAEVVTEEDAGVVHTKPASAACTGDYGRAPASPSGVAWRRADASTASRHAPKEGSRRRASNPTNNGWARRRTLRAEPLLRERAGTWLTGFRGLPVMCGTRGRFGCGASGVAGIAAKHVQ